MDLDSTSVYKQAKKNLANILPFWPETCLLFLRYRREIFILGVLRFLKMTPSFPKTPDEVCKVFRRILKSSENVRSPSLSISANSLPVLSTSKIRDRKKVIVICSFYTWFSFLTWVWVHIFLKIVWSKTAATHIFQSGVRNWLSDVSRQEIKVFNPQAWELAGVDLVNTIIMTSGIGD